MSDEYWDRIRTANEQLSSARSVDEVIAVCDKEFPAEKAASGSGDAFYPGGSDEGVFDCLDEAGWAFVWVQADYYFAAKAPDGTVLTFIEGDIYRGDRR